jgi:hypothetical protein
VCNTCLRGEGEEQQEEGEEGATRWARHGADHAPRAGSGARGGEGEAAWRTCSDARQLSNSAPALRRHAGGGVGD